MTKAKTKVTRATRAKKTRIGTWVRLSPANKARVLALAEARDTNISDYVRQAVIEKLEREDRGAVANG